MPARVCATFLFLHKLTGINQVIVWESGITLNVVFRMTSCKNADTSERCCLLLCKERFKVNYDFRTKMLPSFTRFKYMSAVLGNMSVMCQLL